MPEKRPAFMNSPFFVDEPGNWHMSIGAPLELQIQLHDYLRELEQNVQEPGTINGVHIKYPY